MPSLRRRLVLERLLALAGGLAAALGGARTASAAPQLLTVSGGGVNVKQMPAAEGEDTVPLRESFSFDAHYAQCIVEDNPAAFGVDTFSLGRVVIEAHAFFMAMYASEVSLVSIRSDASGKRVARLVGSLGCATEAGTGTVTLGSREVTEPATFEIEATDGGHGGGGAGDVFAFTVSFDPDQAPVNHAIFGPTATFTGDMVAGEVTIDVPIARPVQA